MKYRLRTFLIILALSVQASAHAQRLQPPESSTDERFAVGQVWIYKTRPTEEASRVLIGKIESVSGLGNIIHVKLIGLRLRESFAPDTRVSVMNHAPMSEVAFASSVIELTDELADLEGFSEGYNTWRSAFRAGEAGIFTISLAEAIGFIDQMLSQ
ncbi:MAG: hypothetical protein HKN28_01320 [Alphaproteobacteria bacterium]|nr:hypothetical protein [Alphaproteobacteria bacterium]